MAAEPDMMSTIVCAMVSCLSMALPRSSFNFVAAVEIHLPGLFNGIGIFCVLDLCQAHRIHKGLTVFLRGVGVFVDLLDFEVEQSRVAYLRRQTVRARSGRSES